MIWPFLATLWLSPPADVPSTQAIQAAIQSLAPRRVPAKRYARIIHREARRRNIDPFLIVAFIHIESTWNSQAKSSTDDFGLTQVHVAVNGSATFLGREEALYDPATNIREWGRLAVMWRNYHERTCKDDDHPFYSHLKWGRRVKDTEHADRVSVLYKNLRRRFTPRPNFVWTRRLTS
jgi:hypothetical protein